MTSEIYCAECGDEIHCTATRRRSKFCSDACKQQAYRSRREFRNKKGSFSDSELNSDSRDTREAANAITLSCSDENPASGRLPKTSSRLAHLSTVVERNRVVREEFEAASERNVEDLNWKRHLSSKGFKGRVLACHTCGQLFGGLTGFDAHRVGEFKDEHPDYGRRCLDDEEITARGYESIGGVWRQPMDETTLAMFKKASLDRG